MKERVLYSKSSIERKPEYRQITTVFLDGEKKKVKKTPMGSEASKHIYRYIENAQELMNGNRKRELVDVVPCYENEDGSVWFPFCEETSLSQKLGNCNSLEYVNEIRRFVEALESAFGVVPFQPGEGFRELFGGIDPDYSGQSLCISNLDMNFDNVFLKGSQYLLIDYEWVVHFPVPLQYILFRSFLSDVSFAKLSDEDRLFIYGEFGINEKLQKQFWEMELHFQNYVSGGNNKLDSLHITESSSVCFGELMEYKQAYTRQKEALEEYKQAYDRQQEAIEEYKQAHDRQQEAIQTLNGQLEEIRNQWWYKAAMKLKRK